MFFTARTEKESGPRIQPYAAPVLMNECSAARLTRWARLVRRSFSSLAQMGVRAERLSGTLTNSIMISALKFCWSLRAV